LLRAIALSLRRDRTDGVGRGMSYGTKSRKEMLEHAAERNSIFWEHAVKDLSWRLP